jgi:phosphatidylglycerol---prolipoprotein diacylglyceryl transferase
MPLIITFPFSPVAISLGPLAIRWYGIGYAVAFLAGLWLAGRHLRQHGVSERLYGDMAFWAIVIGLVAARLYFVAQSGFDYYLTHPQHLLAFWEGGMAYFGAVFTVPIFLFLYCWRKRLSFWLVADAAALFAAIGQPIGRIGNIFNGDVIGYPSDLPWAMRYTSPDTFAPELGVAYQPSAAYELLIGLVILGILLALRRWLRPAAGVLFIVYLGLYAVSQFLIFFLRDNSLTLLGLKQAQLSAIVLGLFVIVLALVWAHGNRKEANPHLSELTSSSSPEA